MDGHCDGKDTEYVEGRCCKEKEQKQFQSTSKNEIEMRTWKKKFYSKNYF